MFIIFKTFFVFIIKKLILQYRTIWYFKKNILNILYYLSRKGIFEEILCIRLIRFASSAMRTDTFACNGLIYREVQEGISRDKGLSRGSKVILSYGWKVVKIRYLPNSYFQVSVSEEHLGKEKGAKVKPFLVLHPIRP